MGWGPDDLLCSRNARPQKALVGRAQWKINQAPILEEITSELGIFDSKGGRSTCAVGGQARPPSLSGREEDVRMRSASVRDREGKLCYG